MQSNLNRKHIKIALQNYAVVCCNMQSWQRIYYLDFIAPLNIYKSVKVMSPMSRPNGH